MVGITRIKIVSARKKDWRFEMAEALAPAANQLYRTDFANRGMILADGEQDIECTKDEAIARYDWREGIDVILRFEDGTRATLQEKFLTFFKDTVTFEERKTSGVRGVWYTCTAQYYFVGYAREWCREWRPEDQNGPESEWPKIPKFHSHILVDLPALHRLDQAIELNWQWNQNARDGRRSTFRFLYFQDVPDEAVIWQYPRRISRLTLDMEMLKGIPK